MRTADHDGDRFGYDHMLLDPATGEVLLFGRRTPTDEIRLFDADDMAQQLREQARALDLSQAGQSWAGEAIDPVDDYVRRFDRSFDTGR